MPQCPPMNFPCPPNSKLEHPEGQCCPRCVEREFGDVITLYKINIYIFKTLKLLILPGDGVCTVFGDPHYRTFDGKFYSFKGACKYQLVTDCFYHTFSIRVTNDARKTMFSAWTKTIAIKVSALNTQKISIQNCSTRRI